MLCGAGMIVMGCVLWISAAPAEESADLAQQRLEFVAAEQALKQNKTTEFQRRLETLTDYPLYPYLLYQELRPRLNKAAAAEVYGFLWAYGDSPVAWRLHDAWLRELAGQGRWQDFLIDYQPSDSNEVQCLYRRALINTGNVTDAFAELDILWLTGQPLPAECDSLIEAWRKDGGLSDDLVWRRLGLVMEAGNTDLARYLSRLLPPADQLWTSWWLELRQRPERIKTPPKFNPQHPGLPGIFAYGIKRLALNDAAGAAEVWQAIRATQSFTAAQTASVNRSLALALATQNDPQAVAWLSALSLSEEDTRVRERRVLLAMNSGDWSAVLTWISQLSSDEQAMPRWRYWQARALEYLGFPEQATAVYTRLVGRDYYGFLAADRLGQPYAITHRPLEFSAEEMVVVEQVPGIRRAREFYALGRLADTRREWNYAIQGFDESIKLRAARLAHGWGWRDGAIFTIAQAPRQDDLDLLFPLDHREHVELRARDSAIDPAWAFAIMRQESAFVADARSPVGALGLMQIMPATARMIAKGLKMKLKNIDNLLLPEINVRLGTAYLRTGLDRFAANPVLATAAYNAGVGRVRQWIPSSPVTGSTLPAELWVENIPFKETRDYVRRVMAFTVIYQYRLGGEPVSLSRLMLPIGEDPAPVAGAEVSPESFTEP